ncbi:isocitrate lyase/PEP mutase family protein [Methylobacterium aquaticum]|uniref:isocitrate lyase/PEP mutase family protein n=1 Tax=Methylobacterium aquaticum TaxID=270351 RepID=UPI003D185411
MDLRMLLRPGAGQILPGVANAVSARIAEMTGFPAAFVTGAGVANSFLGMPDMGLLTLTELVGHVAAIREATNLPLIADGDTGFGNALNAQRAVRLLERAGANAIQLEDQVFPKRCGHFDGKAVVPQVEMVQKIRAAADARRDESFLIIGRTDARAIEGLAGALDRAAAYQEAGADLLFVEAPSSLDELAAIPRQVPGIHLCNMVFGGKTPLLPASELGAMGFAGVIYANAALQATMRTVVDVFAHLRDTGSLSGIDERLASFRERQAIVDQPGFFELDARYATLESKDGL